MRYRSTTQLTLLLGLLIGSLLCACSNSEGVDEENEFVWDDDEDDYKHDDEEGKEENEGAEVDLTKTVKKLGKECFDSLRLPKLNSEPCKEMFYAPDTVSEFPESGFFQKTFTIIFPENKPLNCEIGGKPATEESPLISTIQIDSSMTIRCADYSDNATSNAETIRTYILEQKPNLPAVFITTDPNSLFDPDTGIYMEGPNANEKTPHYGANYWLDKEIPIFIEFVEQGAEHLGFAQHAGLKIFGNYSRIKAKKSVAITFREKYGNKRLYYNLFPKHSELNSFKSFILRNNGQNFENDYIRDRLVASLSNGLDVDYQQGRFAIVYYNSKYFGIHDLRERSNEYYFETHYGINSNNINLLKADNSVSAGTSNDYISLMNWLKENSIDKDDNYAYISSQIDINNYINYMQLEIFANNRDWPGNNQKKWNIINPKSQWKWFLYDTDQSFGSFGSSTTSNVFDYVLAENSSSWVNSPAATLLFRSLLKNKNIKDSFINRMVSLLQMNLSTSNILIQIDNLMKEIESEIPRDQERWSLDASRMNKHLNVIKQFAEKRPGIIIEHLQEYFKLGNTIPITFSTKGSGTILVHGLPLSNNPVTIKFFDNLPVLITAQPQNGHIWQGWNDGEKNATRIIHPKTKEELIAIFK